jgi:hypothetical protein
MRVHTRCHQQKENDPQEEEGHQVCAGGKGRENPESAGKSTLCGDSRVERGFEQFRGALGLCDMGLSKREGLHGVGCRELACGLLGRGLAHLIALHG